MISIPSGPVPEQTTRTASTSALSSSSLDSESTPSSKQYSQFPSTATLAIGTTQTEYVDKACTVPLQEPDVIASTKPSTKASTSQKSITSAPQHSNNVNIDAHVPVAPPRRKKKNKAPVESLALTVSVFVKLIRL